MGKDGGKRGLIVVIIVLVCLLSISCGVSSCNVLLNVADNAQQSGSAFDYGTGNNSSSNSSNGNSYSSSEQATLNSSARQALGLSGSSSFTENDLATVEASCFNNASIKPDANGNYVYRVVEGKVDFNAGDTPQVNFPSELIMTTTDGATDLATLAKTGTGIYTGTYTVKEAWENFKINDREGNVLYGSDPTDLYKLSSDAGCWSIWFDQNAAAGDVVTITVNLNTLTWSYSK